MSDRLAEIKARHQQIEMVSEWGADSERYPACKRCRDPWPCDTMVLLAEGERLLVVVAGERSLVPAPVIPNMAKALGIEMAATTYPPAGPYLDACIKANKEIDRITREYAERGRALVEEAGRAEDERTE